MGHNVKQLNTLSGTYFITSFLLHNL